MKKKVIIVLVFSFIAAVLMETLAWVVAPANVPLPVTIPEDAEKLDLSVDSYTSGYDCSGSTYIPNNDDPQIGFVFSGRDIAAIYIEFEEPLSQNIAVQIYYATDGENLNETNHVEFIAVQGSDHLVAALPHNIYTHVRLDINGEFSLGGIYASNEEMKIEYIKGPPQIYRFFFGWIFLSMIGGLCCIPYSISIQANSKLKQQESGYRKALLPFVIFLVMGALVALRVNNSSMAGYGMVIPNNVSEASQLILGWPRPIRSDEWAVSTPVFFHNQIHGQLAEAAFAQNSHSIIVWINNIITMLNPYYWGELYLPTEYAFSWRFVVYGAFLLWIYYKLFEIITRKKLFSIIASFMIVFAPAIQWWSVPLDYGICGFIVFFYEFFETEKRWKKCLYAWGLVCCTSVIVPAVYPARCIPLIYLFLFVLVGIYLTQKRINFKKTDIPYIAVTSFLMLIVVAAYFISSRDDVQSIMETVYPGKRFSAGGDLPNNYWAHYLCAPLVPWKSGNIPLNHSEISHFLNLFPIPIAIFVAKYQDLKKHKVTVALVLFNIICDIYMVFGIGDVAAKYSLWSYTFYARVHIIWGLSSFMLLLLECQYILPKKCKEFKKRDWLSCFFVNCCIVAFLAWTAITQKALLAYIEADNFIYTAGGLILLGNLLFFGKRRAFVAIMAALTIASGVVVNPINFGTSIMTDTPLAEEIREIDQRDSGNWVTLGDWVTPKYVHAQGVDCLNYLSWPPRFDLFKPLDENGEYYDIYNRYAHVTVNLTTEKTSFSLNCTDSLTLFLNVNDLEKWDVKYIVVRGEMPQRMQEVGFELLYYDPLDNMNIYKVSYYAE